jgi:hypothetical protein
LLGPGAPGYASPYSRNSSVANEPAARILRHVVLPLRLSKGASLRFRLCPPCARTGMEKNCSPLLLVGISSCCVLKELCHLVAWLATLNFLTDATFRRGPFTEEHIGSPLLPLRIPTLRTVQLGDFSFISGPSACACNVLEHLLSHVCLS